MANDIMQRRGAFARGLSDITTGADTAAPPSNLYSSPPPEYTEIEFKVYDPRSMCCDLKVLRADYFSWYSWLEFIKRSSAVPGEAHVKPLAFVRGCRQDRGGEKTSKWCWWRRGQPDTLNSTWSWELDNQIFGVRSCEVASSLRYLNEVVGTYAKLLIHFMVFTIVKELQNS